MLGGISEELALSTISLKPTKKSYPTTLIIVWTGYLPEKFWQKCTFGLLFWITKIRHLS